MKNNKESIKEKPVIIIDEKPDFIPGQDEGEKPIFIIERDDDDETDSAPTGKTHQWKVALISVVLTGLLCLFVVGGIWYYRRHVYIGVPISVTSEQNIKKLKTPSSAVTPEVIKTTDSILGVPFNMYELRGLKGEISFNEPDTTDTDVYLYSRCSDFTSYDPKENEYIGSLAVEGNVLQSDKSRLGYCAMANDNIVIGIARDEKVMDYCIEQAGSFFRQFILVTNRTLPPRYHLHGKVERRAIGRMGEKLYYIESCNKEGMYEFSDALREYGFIDAIYITGGTDYCFYRDAEGKAHDIGDKTKYEEKHKGQGIIPWLVFKKK